LRSFDENSADIIFRSVVDEAAGSVRFEANTDVAAYSFAGPVMLSIGDRPVLRLPVEGRPGPIDGYVLTIDELRALPHQRIELRDGAGSDMDSALDFALSGDFFDALSLQTAQAFFGKIQLNHSRYTSPLLLEMGARAAYSRFDQDYRIQAAALTIIGHRFLELPIEQLKPDNKHLSWLLEQAAAVIARGEAMIESAPEPDWEVARWTISLATVAGYLSLIGDRYVRAESFFAVPVRYVDLVSVARVSALNIVNGCFVHGLLSHVLGRNDVARDSLTTGVKSVPSLVAAQDLMENVWVMGDLMNVMRSARQCFIALVRLKLIPAQSPITGPLINDAAQMLISDVVGPLHALLLGGRSALIARAVVGCGGVI